MKHPEVDKLVTDLHDRLCRCGGRCDGWNRDLAVLVSWFAQRYGSVSVLEEALERWDER